MEKKPSYQRKEAPQPIKKKRDWQATRTELKKTKRSGEVSKERWITVLEKAWKPQSSSGSTSTRATTTLFTSAVHPLNRLSIAGLARSAKRTVPEVPS